MATKRKAAPKGVVHNAQLYQTPDPVTGRTTPNQTAYTVKCSCGIAEAGHTYASALARVQAHNPAGA